MVLSALSSIVMEYADGGDLLQKIFDYKKKGLQFKEEEIWDIFLQIVKGLTALHDIKVQKKCIQSANVFLTKNGVAKLGDMNVSKVVRKDAMCETQTGTPYYASP
jgi:NIMA (never in mitosis gene a)-related kinase 1/4/5